MPTYEFECQKPECKHGFEVILRITEYDTPQDCPKCGTPEAKRLISGGSFNLVGDDWPGKAIRINNQMKKKHELMAPRVEEKKREEPLVTLVPNVEGEVTDSWEDAQKMAKSKGKDAESFEPLVQKERQGEI